MKLKVGILDLNISNVESIRSAVKFLGFDCDILNINQNFEKYSKIIIAGGGSFPAAINNLDIKNFKNKTNKYLKSNNILGICLGLQIFAKSSDEFKNTNGIGLIDEKITKLDFLDKLPNVGFRKVSITKNNFLFDKIPNNSEFYFMHSFGILNSKKKYFQAT